MSKIFLTIKPKKAIIVFLTILLTTFANTYVAGLDEDGRLSDEQAKTLVNEAIELSAFVNQMDSSWGELNIFEQDEKYSYEYKNERLFTQAARDYVSEYARIIYTEELAEKSWKYHNMDNSKKAIFLLDEIDIDNHLLDDVYHGNRILYPIIYPLWPKSKNADSFDPYEIFRNQSLCIVYQDAKRAEGYVICELITDSADMFHEPGEISVIFENTADGWRIAGGDIVTALLNTTDFHISHTYLAFEYYLEGQGLADYQLRKQGYKPASSARSTRVCSITYVSNDLIKMVFGVKVISPSGQSIDGKYSAYFKLINSSGEVLDVNVWNADEDLMNLWLINANHLVLYGGGLYDLLVNGNLDAEQFHGEKSAYTGDGDNVKQTIIFTSAAIAAACACLCVIRKRKENE